MKFGRVWRRLRNEAKLYSLLFRDKRTPAFSKILIVGAVAYLLWPFDLIPDFVPFAGFVDEIIIIPLLFYVATMFIPKDVIRQNREKAAGKRSGHKFENSEVIEGEIVK